MSDLLPPITTNYEGRPRRIGVEIELAGLAPAVMLETVTGVLGGEARAETRFEYEIIGSAVGDIMLELDAEYLKDLARDAQRNEQRSELERLTDDVLAGAAQMVVPWEIVAPPIAMERLMEMAPLVTALRERGARGTRHSPWYAFGLHLNPEMPALDAGTILAYLRAYACLYDWLVDREQLDPSRRWFTPYIETFDTAYLEMILKENYAPDIERLIDDYLDANPTRNKSLDMLPLFAFLDEQRVQARVEDSRVQARPALHYRLPNCDIDRHDWNVDVPWRHWLEVEHLAADPEHLRRACRAFRRELSRGPRWLKTRWIEQCESWLVRPR